jgi:hypothetical protein
MTQAMTPANTWTQNSMGRSPIGRLGRGAKAAVRSPSLVRTVSSLRLLLRGKPVLAGVEPVNLVIGAHGVGFGNDVAGFEAHVADRNQPTERHSRGRPAGVDRLDGDAVFVGGKIEPEPGLAGRAVHRQGRDRRAHQGGAEQQDARRPNAHEHPTPNKVYREATMFRSALKYLTYRRSSNPPV